MVRKFAWGLAVVAALAGLLMLGKPPAAPEALPAEEVQNLAQ